MIEKWHMFPKMVKWKSFGYGRNNSRFVISSISIILKKRYTSHNIKINYWPRNYTYYIQLNKICILNTNFLEKFAEKLFYAENYTKWHIVFISICYHNWFQYTIIELAHKLVIYFWNFRNNRYIRFLPQIRFIFVLRLLDGDKRIICFPSET